MVGPFTGNLISHRTEARHGDLVSQGVRKGFLPGRPQPLQVQLGHLQAPAGTLRLPLQDGQERAVVGCDRLIAHLCLQHEPFPGPTELSVRRIAPAACRPLPLLPFWHYPAGIP